MMYVGVWEKLFLFIDSSYIAMMVHFLVVPGIVAFYYVVSLLVSVTEIIP